MRPEAGIKGRLKLAAAAAAGNGGLSQTFSKVSQTSRAFTQLR
jgi:hypothetical protein